MLFYQSNHALKNNAMYKTIKCFLFACGLIYACNAQAYKSSIEEFNEKFPFDGEIIGALEQVNSIIPAESDSLKSFKSSFATQLELRVFACYPFLSKEEILSKEETDPQKIAALNVKLKNCLQEKDEKLLQFISMSLVGYRLMQDPLRPLAGLGPPSSFPNPEGVILVDGKAASKSNVAVLRFANNESISIEIPSGKKIASLPRYPNGPYYETLLSSNGRVTAAPYNGLNFIDNETGQELWRAKEISRIHAWLPEIQAALVRGKINGIDKLLILDFKRNKVEPYELLNSDQDWALNISESPSRLLIGGYDGFSQIENVRSSTGVKGKVIKEYKLVKGRIHLKSPVSMQGGKSILFRSVSRPNNVFLTLFNLKSGEEKQFETDKFLNDMNYAKLSEEEILVTSYNHTNYFPTMWAFNVNGLTLSPVRLNNFEGLVTMLSQQRWMASRNSQSMLNGRSGFMHLDDKDIWLGDNVEIGKPVRLASVIAERRKEIELTALEEKYGGTGVFETKVAEKRAQLIGKIPHTAKVRAIGIIKAKKNPRSINDSPDVVDVTIKKTKEPIVLLLNSCLHVRWNIVKERGSNLVAVIVTSQISPSDVVGDGDTKTIVRKSTSCAFEKGSLDYIELDREAVLWTSKSIDEFQGAREASSFTVGN